MDGLSSFFNIDENITINPQRGSASVNIPIRVTPGREDFQPDINLTNIGGSTNGPFGIGWQLGVSSISRKLDDGLPTYEDLAEQDIFLLSGADLIPKFINEGIEIRREVIQKGDFDIFSYLQRQERGFNRIQRWVNRISGHSHWQVTNSQNITSVYGHSQLSKIVDPLNDMRVFQWLLEKVYDDKGNLIKYEYKKENNEGVEARHPAESGRLKEALCFNNIYPKRILYGNKVPYSIEATELDRDQFSFEVIFDFGEHSGEIPTYNEQQPWVKRPDPFSTYVPGFELRSYRLCRRILMFHHFSELHQDPTLIGTTNFRYRENSIGSLLEGVTYKGFQRDESDGGFSVQPVPETTFNYSKPIIGQLHGLDLENVFGGINNLDYRFFDLFGEGLDGLLAEHENAWYFKRNHGDGQFGPLELVGEKPIPGQYQLADLDHNGNSNLAVYGSKIAGYFELERISQKWQNFIPFDKIPHIDFSNPNVQLIDLNADGFPDILINDHQEIIWYPSLQKEGFDKPIRLSKKDNRQAPPIIGHDLLQGIYMADMTGDGLQDIMQIQNGSVVFWPNLGFGKFGKPVSMKNSPWMDYTEYFDNSRIRLYDINSSGLADLLYLGSDGIKVWYNESGNSWTEGEIIAQMPAVHDHASITLADLLGNGTACLVWSTLLPNEGKPSLQYLALNETIPSFLLTEVDNNMGMKVKLEYHYSGKFYRQDKQNGSPWHSKIPSHFPVITEKNVIDQIAGATFTSRFVYHDGYYDGEERIFRGFGFVEQFDTKTFDQLTGFPREDYVAPTCIKTWFHNGTIESEQQIGSGYYKLDDLAIGLGDTHVEGGEQFRSMEIMDAYRALSGQMVRQEIYGLDDTEDAKHPYTVQESNYKIRKIQSAINHYKASFLVISCEQLSYNYERNPKDPRISHELVLETDEFGNNIQSCQIAYARRQHPDREPEQNDIIGSLNTVDFADPTMEDALYRHSVPIETKQMELLHLSIDGKLFTVATLKPLIDIALEQALDFHEDENLSGNPSARLYTWERMYYWNDDLSDSSSWGTHGDLALLHHLETAVFTPQLITEIFDERVNTQLLQDMHYNEIEGYWWQKEKTQHYKALNDQGQELPNPFILILKTTDKANGLEQTDYDKNWLLPVNIKDGFGNLTKVEYDYHTLQPTITTDLNGNISESRYDPLGNIILTSQYGTQTDENNQIINKGDNSLVEWVQPDNINFQQVVQRPAEFLQNASTFIAYDLFSWSREQIPLQRISLSRNTHVSDSLNGEEHILIDINFFDAVGRLLQSKQKVESGEAFLRDQNGALLLDNQGDPQIGLSGEERWRVSGHVIYNNKQLPIKQFNPFFSTISNYESESELQQLGETKTLFYDSLGREMRIETADGFYSKIIIDAWKIHSYDENDTVEDSRFFKAFVETGLEQNEDVLDAIEKSRQHSQTPKIVVLNPFGQPFLQQDLDIQGNTITTRTTLNINGLPISVTDPRGIRSLIYRYDMKGRLLYENNVDSGEKWSLPDGLDRPAMLWDGRGVKTQTNFDILHRPISKMMGDSDSNNIFQITEKLEYGESLSDETAAKNKNLRGQLIVHFDQAGLQKYDRFNFKGQILEKQRQLRKEYKEEANWNNVNTAVLESETFIFSYKYNAQGLLTDEHKADGSVHRYKHHLGGGIKQIQVTTADGIIQDQSFLDNTMYNAKGQVIQRLLGNGVTTRLTYDRFNDRLTKLISRRETDGRKWQYNTYHYDPVGNITRIHDKSQIFGQELPVALQLQDYEYDGQYQLTKARGFCHQALETRDNQRTGAPSGSWRKGTRHLSLNNLQLLKQYTREYTYDLGGNLLNTKHQLDDGTGWNQRQLVSTASNRAIALPSNGPPPDVEAVIQEWYDEVGNMIKMQHLSEVVWNYRNNIAKAVIIARGNAPDDAEYYTYGSDGMRVRKVHEQLQNGNQLQITEKIYLDGCEILRIRRGSALQKERITTHIAAGDNHIAHVYHWKQDTGNGSNNLTGQTRVHYQLNDHLGSATIQLNEQGNLISAEGYAPYGGSVWKAGDNLREVDIQDYRYSGKERDDHTGLYYYGFRYYASWLGRWTSTDPAGPVDGVNLYQFVRGNPISFKDHLGLLTQEQRDELRESANKSPIGAGATGQLFTDEIGWVIYAEYDTKYGKLYREVFERVEYEDNTKDLLRISNGEFFTRAEISGHKEHDISNETDKSDYETKTRNNFVDDHQENNNPEEKIRGNEKEVHPDEKIQENKSGSSGLIEELDKANKEFGKEMANQSTSIAIVGGGVSAFAEAGITALKTMDLISDLMAFSLAIPAEGMGLIPPEKTDQIANRLDKKIDDTNKIVKTVTEDPIGIVKQLHESAVDSTYRMFMGESSGFFDVSKITTGVVLGVVGQGKGILGSSKKNMKKAVEADKNTPLLIRPLKDEDYDIKIDEVNDMRNRAGLESINPLPKSIRSDFKKSDTTLNNEGTKKEEYNKTKQQVVEPGKHDYSPSAQREEIQENLLDQQLGEKGYDVLPTKFPNDTGLDRVYTSVDGKIKEISELKAVENMDADPIKTHLSKEMKIKFTTKKGHLGKSNAGYLLLKLLMRNRPNDPDLLQRSLKGKLTSSAGDSFYAKQGTFDYAAAQAVRMMDSKNPDVRQRGKILYDQLYANPKIRRTLRIMDKYGNHRTYSLNNLKW